MAERTPPRVTYSVWHALFLRESVARLFGGRAAWLWLLLEPVANVAFLLFIYSVIRVRSLGGIETSVWLMAGILGFFAFKRTGTQCMNAVGANEALFAYRQVKPIDTVLTRAWLEGFLMLVVTVLMFGGASIVGVRVAPSDPLLSVTALFGLWLLGLGFGLVTSVVAELVPELGKTIGLLMSPLYFLSGVMFPIAHIPPPYRDWLMLNPLVHGVELTRAGLGSLYQLTDGISLGYVYGCGLVGIALGLALHVRFADRLVEQ